MSYSIEHKMCAHGTMQQRTSHKYAGVRELSAGLYGSKVLWLHRIFSLCCIFSPRLGSNEQTVKPTHAGKGPRRAGVALPHTLESDFPVRFLMAPVLCCAVLCVALPTAALKKLLTLGRCPADLHPSLPFTSEPCFSRRPTSSHDGDFEPCTIFTNWREKHRASAAAV